MHIVVNSKEAPPVERVGSYLKIGLNKDTEDHILIPLLFIDFVGGLIWNDPDDPYDIDLDQLETVEVSPNENRPDSHGWQLIETVKSQSRPGTLYRVERKMNPLVMGGRLHDWRCSCPAGIYKKSAGYCKHIKDVMTRI
jgi:hypothetical protein